MLKSFDIRVKSVHSANWYDGFKVDTIRGVVYFVQRDARRNGQVARHMTITVQNNGKAMIEALSAEGGRYERFSRTQCLKLALRLLDEARSEARQVSCVKPVKPMTVEEFQGVLIGSMFLVLTLIGICIMGSLGVEAPANDARLMGTTISGILSTFFLGNAYRLKKERESQE